uniref:Uncharacterized protein n=1 Tax=Leishmania guyanensis TaxID=5670 RepID=A0A1E1J1N7_LEIGU|nr:hypothetical protein, conserved [Leishmania guyanensis]
MAAPLATSAADIPTASLACNVPPGATRADSRKRFPEALTESPQGPVPRVEAVDERKQLFRTRLCPTPLRVPASESAEWRCEALGASLTAPGVTFTDSVLGATFLNSLPSPCPLPRPPTPAFLPVAGALPPPSLSIAKTVPFSLEEHLTWLYASASPTESRSSATVPPDMVAASCGLGRAERVRASRSERERKHESSRSTVSATVTQHSDLPIAPADVQEKAAPALMQDQGSASTATTLIPPNPLAPQHGEISYESSFSVVTSWDALMVAPPLLRTTPRMPSLLAHDVAGVGTTAARFGRLATSVHVCMSDDATRIPFNGSQGESLIGTSPAMETNEASQGGEARAGAEQQKPVFPSSHCAPSPAAVPPRVKCDGHEWSRKDLLRQVEEDGVRTFVKHFTNGLVFVDPPWFICPVLLDNCEHPYYMTWLDELEVGSVEEAVAEAKAKLLADA